jgi:hypothetical protein
MQVKLARVRLHDFGGLATEASHVSPVGLSSSITQLARSPYRSPTTGSMGRTMVYSWDDKEAVCYKLYVEERRSLEDVMSHFEMRSFTPRYGLARVLSTGCRILSRSGFNMTMKPGQLLCRDADYSTTARGPSNSSSNDGTSQASKTQDTRILHSSPASTNYGSRTTLRRTWSTPCRLRASRSMTAS